MRIKEKNKEDLFSYYDIDINGYIRNERGKTLEKVYAYIINELKNKYNNLWHELDYFELGCKYEYKKTALFPFDFRWLAVFYVTGSNEGYYFHILEYCLLLFM